MVEHYFEFLILYVDYINGSLWCKLESSHCWVRILTCPVMIILILSASCAYLYEVKLILSKNQTCLKNCNL